MIKKISNLSLDHKNLLSNFSSLAVLQAANYILPFLILPYLVRVLGVEKFGILAFAQAFVLYSTVIVDFGFNMSATHEISTNRNNKKAISEVFTSVFLIKFALFFVSFLVLCIVIFNVEHFYENREIFIYSFGVVLGNALFPVWLFQGMERMKAITAINVSTKIIAALLMFIFVKAEADFYKVPILNSIGFILAGIIGLVYGIKIFDLKLKLAAKARILTIFKESFSLFIANISVSLYTATNTVVLGFFASDSIVGIYAAMEKLIMAAKMGFTPLYSALFPWMAKKPKDDIYAITRKMIKYIFAAGVFGTAFTLVFAEQILSIIFNDDLITSYFYILQIMSFIFILAGLNMLFNMLFLSAIKAYKERMKIMIIAGIFNVVVVCLLTYKFSITGASFAVILTESLLLFMGYYYFRKSVSHG